MTEMLPEYLGISIAKAVHSDEPSNCKPLRDGISAQITFRREIIGKVIISVEERLAGHIVKHMDIDMQTDDEEESLMGDALGELLNIIVGSSTEIMSDNAITIYIDPPLSVDLKRKYASLIQTGSFCVNSPPTRAAVA